MDIQERLEKIYPSHEADEKAILFIRKHWFLFFMVFLILFGMLLLPTIVLIITIKYFPQLFSGSVINILVIFGSMYLLFLCAIFLIGFINLYFDVVILTNKRIIDINQKGLFHRVVDELDLLHVEDVASRVRGILGTFFDFGTVEIQTAGTERNFIFTGIPNPRKLCQLILAQYKELLKADQFEAVRRIDSAEGLGSGRLRSSVHEEMHGRQLKPRPTIDNLIDRKNLTNLKSQSGQFPQIDQAKSEGELVEGKAVDLNKPNENQILIKFNIKRENLAEVLKILPSLKSPTINDLIDPKYVAIESVVKKSELGQLLPQLKAKGATDIIQSGIRIL